jgi:hypothetical protein
MAYFNHANYDSGNNLTFEVNPDIGIQTGKEFNNDLKESLGGAEFVTQAHSGKRTWQWSWSNISSTFKGQLETFRNTVGGNFKSFTYNDGSSNYTVRMSSDSLQFNEQFLDRFSTNIRLREVTAS